MKLFDYIFRVIEFFESIRPSKYDDPWTAKYKYHCRASVFSALVAVASVAGSLFFGSPPEMTGASASTIGPLVTKFYDVIDLALSAVGLCACIWTIVSGLQLYLFIRKYSDS